jgi:hypothetical protein
MSALHKLSFLLFLSFVLVNCEPSKKGDLPVEKSFARVDVPVPDAINTDIDKFPLSSLSEYGFFDSPLASLHPRELVLPYEPITSLFTDYAYKKRFVWMPKGAEAQIDAEGVVQFTLGTILIKHFY